MGYGQENLNRIGGEPSWIQDAEFPSCPLRQERMPYLLQLDSCLPSEHGGECPFGGAAVFLKHFAAKSVFFPAILMAYSARS